MSNAYSAILSVIDTARALQLRSLSAVDNFPAIVGFKGKLLGFQQVGMAYALAVRKCGIFDVTGLGKTVEALALMQYLANKGELYPAIVMMPASIMRQWDNETHRFTGLKPILLRGTRYERQLKLARHPPLMYINYELFVRYPRMLDDYERFGLIVFDEASSFKNPEAKTTAAVVDLAHRAARVHPMTATPVQTSLLDMWSLMQVLHLPDYPQQEDFEAEHIKSVLVDMRYRGRRFKFKKLLGYKDLPGARAIFEPWFIRRKLDQVDAELPDLVWKEEKLTLDDDHMQAYRRLVKAGTTNIMQLQQFINMARLGNRVHSAKIDRVLELLSGELLGQKIIVFSWFKAPIAEISRRLNDVRMPNGKKGLSHIIVTGDVTGQTREHSIERFVNNKNCYVCLCDGAAEKGLNLQVASYMILLDRFSNPSRSEQLIGRFHRIGSAHSTIIAIPLIAEGTHEEAIFDLIQNRVALSGYMLREGSDLYPEITPAEIRRLLKLK